MGVRDVIHPTIEIAGFLTDALDKNASYLNKLDFVKFELYCLNETIAAVL